MSGCLLNIKCFDLEYADIRNNQRPTTERRSQAKHRFHGFREFLPKSRRNQVITCSNPTTSLYLQKPLILFIKSTYASCNYEAFTGIVCGRVFKSRAETHNKIKRIRRETTNSTPLKFISNRGGIPKETKDHGSRVRNWRIR